MAISPTISPKTAVFGTLIGLAIVQVVLALLTSSAYPYSDDWALVPAVVGDEDTGLGWLFAGHNEHRIPLVKLIHLILLRATDLRYPVVAAFNVVLIAVAAFALLRAIRRWRSEWRRVDALIPLILLSPLLPIARWSFSTHFCLVLLGVCLLLSTRFADRPKDLHRADVLVVIVAMTLLLTAGLQGALVAAVFGVALLVGAIRSQVANRPVTAAVAVVTLAAAGSIIATRPAGGGVHDDATVGSTAAAFVHLIADGISPLFAALPIPACLLAIATVLMVARRTWPTPGPQNVAFGITAAAATFTATAISVSRSGSGWGPGITLGYSLLVLPIGLVIALGSLTSAHPAAKKMVAAALLLSGISVIIGSAVGIQAGVDNAREGKAVSQQLEAGVSSEQIARDHIDFFYFDESEARIHEVADRLELLRNR